MSNLMRLSADTVPKDRDVIIVTDDGEYLAWFVDCQWLRDEGDDVPDCFRSEDCEDDIELDRVRGWRPAAME